MSYNQYWNVTKTLVNENDCYIIIVTPIITNDLSKIDIDDLNSKNWIIKIMNNRRFLQNELGKVNINQVYNCIHSVKFPINDNYRSGAYGKWSWYVIEYLPDYIKNCSEQIKKNIGKFVNDITIFLEWLHIEKNIIHGDIKIANIVCDISKNIYRLIDFEHLDNTSQVSCIDYLPNGYYYYAFGCDFNKSYYSFRHELQALGYIIWNILESKDNVFKFFEWQEKAIFFYDNKYITDNFTYLEDIKNNIQKPKIIKEYFDIISHLDWNEKQSNKEIYEKIRNLFNKDI